MAKSASYADRISTLLISVKGQEEAFSASLKDGQADVQCIVRDERSPTLVVGHAVIAESGRFS